MPPRKGKLLPFLCNVPKSYFRSSKTASFVTDQNNIKMRVTELTALMIIWKTIEMRYATQWITLLVVILNFTITVRSLKKFPFSSNPFHTYFAFSHICFCLRYISERNF